jgi:hypothetical protein
VRVCRRGEDGGLREVGRIKFRLLWEHITGLDAASAVTASSRWPSSHGARHARTYQAQFEWQCGLSLPTEQSLVAVSDYSIKETKGEDTPVVPMVANCFSGSRRDSVS